MTLKYYGKNILVKSAVNRAEHILHSPFFQQQLLQNLDDQEAIRLRDLITSLNNPDLEEICITTFWNPFKNQESIIQMDNKVISLNLAKLRKSRRFILQQIIKNFSNLSYGGNINKTGNNYNIDFERHIRVISQAYS